MRQFFVSSDTGAPVQYWWPMPGGIPPVDHLLLQGIKGTVNVLKFLTFSFFYSQIKCWFSGLKFTKCLSE